MNIIKSTALLFVSLFCFASCEINLGGGNDPEPEPQQTKITLDKEEAFVKIDGQIVLTATVEPESKASELQWISSAENIASVENGVVTAHALGTATVIAFIDNVIANCKINVVETSVEKINLSKTEMSLSVGDSERITATVEPEDAENQNIDWFADDETVVKVKEGLITALKVGKTDVVARIGHVESRCAVTVKAVPVTGISISPTTAEITENETVMLTVTITPDNATDKTLDWATDNAAVATVAPIDGMEYHCIVSGISEGKTVITAFAGDGEFSASCEITVKPADKPQAEPKIGDYYYSDGTWSDGGLVSIEPDGTNPVWAETKPAPIEGKTVIGIVFQTDQSRIAETEKSRGFTHGYVVAAKSAYDPNLIEKYGELTMYSLDGGFSCLHACKIASTWYKNIEGWEETNTVLGEYSGKIYQCPAFDLTTTDFKPTAPVTSSGWFLPATGQAWDMLANLCGDEVAKFMKEHRTDTYDVSFYFSNRIPSYDVLSVFNEKFSKIPESQREDLKVQDKFRGYCTIWTSSSYSGEAACVFNIGDLSATDKYSTGAGIIEGSYEWVDCSAYARPILAF